MKIGLVSAEFPPERGGVQTYAWEYGHELARRGHEVVVFTQPHAGGEAPTGALRIEPALRLRCRLDREVFFKVMVDFGRSDNYTPQDKAAIFNRLLPIKGNSSVYPVYQDVMLDWAAKGGEGGHFWSFVGHLESSELREYLARGYYASAAVDLAKLEEIIEFEADRQSESFLGRDYQARSRSLAQLVNSLVAGNVLSRAEVDGLLTRIDVDLGFKRDLTARLAAESNP